MISCCVTGVMCRGWAMSRPRLTKQRYDTLICAMAFWETYIEDMEVEGDQTAEARQLRREFNSAMEWLWATKQQSGVS